MTFSVSLQPIFGTKFEKRTGMKIRTQLAMALLLVPETIPHNSFQFIVKEKSGGRGLVFYDFGARFYLPGSPQWISMDPLAEKYYSISPYVYCAGDPMNRIDIFGKEPIKRNAGTISGFITFMNSIPTGIGSSMGIKAHDAMLRMGVFKGRKPANTAPFNNSNGNRYLYTKKGGWIDMSHFMFYAGRAYHYKQQKIKAQAIVNSKEFSFLSSEVQARLIYQAFINPAEEAVREGRLQEFSDLFFSPQSAYSYEDLPSDKFGADFGAFYFDPDSKKTFAEQLLDYLTDILNGTAPQDAPNYQDLPSDYPKKPSQRNRTTNPIYVQ